MRIAFTCKNQKVLKVKDVLTCGQMQTAEIRLCRMITLKDALVYHIFWTQKHLLETEINIQHVHVPFKHKLNISACQHQ